MPTKTFDFHIVTTGVGLGHIFDIPRVSSGVEEFLETIAAESGERIEASVTVTRVASGFNFALTVAVGGVGESFDLTEPASGLSAQIEGLAIGNGKTWSCNATITEAAA